MKKIFVLVASLFLCTLFANAQNNVIDNELQKILNQKGNDYIDVNIMLKAQMTSDDFAVLNCKSDSKEVRREIVTNELKKFAEKSQKDIMSVINAEERSNSVIDIKTHWIANFINCKAKRDVIYQLASHPDVALITHNSEMDTEFMLSNEETRGTQAATGTIAQHVTQIKADKVWDLGYTGKGVVVAVLDSGSNLNHTDIKDHLWNGNGKYGYNVHSTNSTPSDEGSNGHGTHCAGIVCGDGTSGQKTGIAPDATLMTIKIIGGGRCTAQNLVEGVQKAAELGADVISLSVGRENPDENRALFRQTFTNLLQQYNIAAAVACGNDGNSIATISVPHNVRTPGDCPPPWIHPDQQGNAGGKTSVISVGAVNENNVVSPSSSKGPVTWQDIAGYNDYDYNPGIGLIRPDIAAPGENVYSLKDSNTNGYWGKSGTSQAAPCVAGVMALMLEKNPNLTPADLCRIIETTASNKPATKNNSMGSGVIDALAAVQAVNFDEAIVLNPYDFTRTLNTGSNLDLELTLINNGSGSTNENTTVTISENDNYTTIVTDSKSYSTMASGKTASATFVVSVDALAPDNHEVTFTVNAGTRTFDIVVTISNEFVAPSLTATANENNINLTWNATNNATSYNVYRDGIYLTNTKSTSYTDSGLEYGTIYAYTVTSKRGDLESEHSLITRAQTEDNPDRPSPTNVVANNGTVTWTNGAESKGSNIYRKDVTTSVETSIATNVNGTSYTDNTWNSLADGVYQYGVANTYSTKETIYTEDFTNLTLTTTAGGAYPTMNMYWYSYYEGYNYQWTLASSINNGPVGNELTFSSFSGNSAFIKSNYTSNSYLSYLVTRPMDYTQYNGKDVKLSFYYITPSWSGSINTLKVMISTTSYNSGWTELWSSNKTDVKDWTEQEVDLSAYVGQTFYIAFVNVAGYGYCTGVDNVSVSVEGSSESRIEWSDIVGKNVNMFVKDGDWSNTDNWTAKRFPNETEKVIIDANATITSGNITVNSLVINEGKSLTLNNGVILTVNGDFANTDVDAFIINDGAQVFQSNNDVAATFNMNIINPDEWSANNKTGWQFIASPMTDAKISDFIPTSSDYDLYKYDGTKELEWLNHKDGNTYEPVLPTVPQNLLAEAIGTSSIRLSWSPVDGATSYYIYNNGSNTHFATATNNIYEITGLMPGTEYCYTVTAVNDDGESEKPSAVCTKTITLAPQNLQASSNGTNSIKLTWNTVTGTERYYVYKGNEKIASVTSMSYTVNGLDPATTYCFTVTSVGSEFLGIESAKSNEACATTDITIPSAPQNVVLVATSPYSVKLTWDPVAGADSYNIYFIAGGEAAIDVKATEYIFEGLTPGMGYCYNVTAVNAKGESQPSGSNSVNTPLPTPAAPELTATAVGSAVELTWNAPAYAATYKVYNEEGLEAESISSTTYTVYDLEAGEHCFTVIAVNAEGSESGASNKACAIVTEQEQGPIVENVIIGDGNSTSIALPIYSNCAYSISQQIYTRAEIGQTGSIKAVSFKYKSGVTSSCTRTVKVYLQRTTKAFFTSGTDWVSMTNADLVYDGNITINNTPDEWVRINLIKQFEYTGDNLVVCVYDYTGKADSEITFAADQINELKGMSYYSTMFPNPLDPSNVNKTGFYNPIKRNQIRFSFDTGAPEPPQNLVVRSTDATTIHLSWDPSDGATSYEIYLGNMGGDPIETTSDTEYDVTGLINGKTYCYAVKAVNDKGKSDYSELECATAGDIQLETIPVTFTLRDSWGDGWNGNKLSVSYPELEGTFNGTYTIDETTFDPYPYDDKKRYTYTFTLEIPKGYNVTLTYIKSNGANPATNENSFDVKCENGIVLFSAAQDSLAGGEVFEFIADCTPKAPNAPVLEANATSSTEIALTWNKVSGATSYNVYQDDAEIATGLTTKTYNVEGLNPGTNYCFTVTAVNAVGESDASEEVCENTLKNVLVEVGNDKNPTGGNTYLPAYDFYKYAMSQQIYTAEELGFSGGNINSIAFKLSNNTSSTTRQYEVYIANTSLNTFNGNSFVSVSKTDKVFDGSVYISGTKDSWYTINFDKSFDYAGYNIIITVYDKTGSSAGNPGYHTFYVYSTSGRTLYKNNNNSALDMSNLGTGYTYASTDQIQFGMSVDPTPTAPQNLVATAESSSSISLSWKPVAVATSYNVYKGAELVANNVTGATYTVQGLNPETPYCFTVKTVNELGESAASAEACATTKMLAPSAPTDLVATSNGENSIILTWNASATATSYNIYQDVNTVATGVTGTTYTVEGLDAGTEYCFTVKAVNDGGESAASNEDCAETDAFTGCNIIFTLNDSYGDGWISNYLEVSYSGTTKKIEFPGDASSRAYTKTTETLGISQGTEVTIRFIGNYWATENSFVITYEDGTEIINQPQFTSKEITQSYPPFIVDCTPKVPNKPIVTAKPISDTEIELTISASGADTYNIYQKGAIIATDVTGDTYIVSGLSAGTEYCFTVVAVNEVGNSEISDEACATTYKSGFQIIEIGEENMNAYSAPIYDYGSWYGYHSLTQQIYLKDEINSEECAITSISFKNSWGNNNTRNLVVYMTNVDKSSFESGNDWIAVPESDIVYQGQHTFGMQGEWTTISFQTPFVYEGNNICLTVKDKTNETKGTSYYDAFYGTKTSGEYRGIYINGDAEFNVSNITSLSGNLLTYYNSQTSSNLPYVVDIRLTTEPVGSAKSSAPAKMTDIKGGFDKVSAFGTSSGTELSKFETTFQQGIGYLASYETETKATFKGTLNHEKSYTFNLAAYDDSKNLANFNLLGNPFSFNMNWDNTTASGLVNGYAVVNEQGGYNYLTTGVIKVGDGFFVKATDANPSLTYNTRGNRNHEKASSLNVISSSKAGDDNVIINLAGEQEGFPKIKNFNENIAVVYVTEDDMAYGIYNCNEDALEVELAFKVSNMGEYNIHIEPNGYFDYVTLVDLSNGSETNMLTSSYSFTAVPKENGKRFVLKFAKSEMPEGQDNFVYQSGKELIVETEGTVQIIDIMGRVIYSNEVTNDNNRIDISGLHSAAYIVRLINNDSVKTQKVVVY